jgi:predicted amidophosphoribosyltransferase
MQLSPKQVHGNWDDGFTLDTHIQSSQFTGYNDYGHPQFDTVRTELGELLYRLKYKGDLSAVAPIAEAAVDFLRQWNPGIDSIVPAPPSRTRLIQPLFQIADEIGSILNLPVDKGSVRKIKETPELKNVEYAKRFESLSGAYAVDEDALRGRRILLLDDLYQSGATLNATACLLKGAGGAIAVFALALTRARG